MRSRGAFCDDDLWFVSADTKPTDTDSTSLDYSSQNSSAASKSILLSRQPFMLHLCVVVKVSVHAVSSFQALIMMIRKPRATALMYKTGNMVCTGTRSEESSYIAARRFARIVQKLGHPVRFLNFKIQTMVGSCKIFPVNLEKLALTHRMHCSYEPELFPALFYKVMPGVSVTVFASGRASMETLHHHCSSILSFNMVDSLSSFWTFQVEEIPSNKMEIPALGRPFTLGMLYDAWKDELIPGVMLWDEETLQKNTTEAQQPKCELQSLAADTTDSKSSLLNVDASLKAGFLGGLFEVRGSAKYLNDKKKFKNQSRVTLKYKATTKFKQLKLTPPANMDEQQKDLIERSSATHVVTGILYGANAVFVFDSEKLESARVNAIHASMEAVMSKIPRCDCAMNAQIQLTDEEKALTNKYSCKFYGDFILDSNPSTFEEAVNTYTQLPKLLGETRHNSVPLKVWLTPLPHFDSKAEQLMSEIAVGPVRKVEKAVEDLRQMEMRCNDYLTDEEVKKLPQINEKLKKFQELCNDYISKLQQTVKQTLPSIRAGKLAVSSLEKHFEGRDKSPFSHEKLTKWMDHKEGEINAIMFCLGLMKETNTKIVQDQSEVEKELLAPGVEDALCFVFTSLGSADPCLDAMSNHLDSPESESTNEEYRDFSDEMLAEMKEKAKAFHDVVKGLKNNKRFSFLVAALPNEKYTVATIYHYKDGKLVSDDFTQPDIPDVRAVRDRRDLIWYACDLTMDPDTANNNLNLSEKNKKVAYGRRQVYPDLPDRFDTQPQILCEENLHRRHYWEVEFSNGHFDDVGVAVTYKGIERKKGGVLSRLGHNALSWYFGFNQGFQAWHDGKQRFGPLPADDHNRIGVYLDWPAGTLSFYRVSSNTLTHLHTFNTTFTEHVYPAIWVKANYVSLCRF
ncbi:neoverrucotoxin subunit alpha-like [Scomber scombrus]|uniref:neoverrucotoxin subunit alpha-like n=1 Tax=Scomber scombrus TaxID=13677 RepID=UPI002DD91F34|nr:neoverrucotoxin subunit alpha-like [Scomber scombrus]